MITKKMQNMANKIAFVIQQYPDHKMTDVLKLMEVPAIDINTGFWVAEDLGWIETPDKKTGVLTLKSPPLVGNWEFGPEVDELKESLTYAIGVLNKRESDLEEFFLSQWTNGKPGLDVLVAVKSLLVEGSWVEYEVKDQQIDEKGNKVFKEDEVTPIMDTYIFYTLYENRDKQWGRKDFKTNVNTKGTK